MFGRILALSLIPGSAWAGSITATGVIAGPDSSPAKADAAAVHYNPAAIAATTGFNSMLDLQVAKVHVEATATRNDGIDPNTGEAYNVAMADAVVPVFYLGATYKLIPDRLAFGFGITDSFVGGGDYSGAEESPPPYKGHQRYAGITVKIITISMMPSVGLTVVDGLHVGGGFHYVMDSINVLQASDPVNSEGVSFEGPYSFDTILEASGSGGHTAWSTGIFFDKFKFAQVGLSFTSGGNWNVDGEATVTGAELLLPANEDAGLSAGAREGIVSMSQPLPSVFRAHVVSKIAMAEIGAGIEYQGWGMCCGGPEGDLVIAVSDPDGVPLSTATGEIAPTLYSPRRLRNSMNFILSGSLQASPKLWIGTRLGYNTSAVPDYAVSATNLDFESVGAMFAARYKIGPMAVGLAYSKFIPFTRTITTSAWNAAEGSDDYVDDRFSPKLPYKANTNGEYKAVVDIIGVRLQAGF